MRKVYAQARAISNKSIVLNRSWVIINLKFWNPWRCSMHRHELFQTSISCELMTTHDGIIEAHPRPNWRTSYYKYTTHDGIIEAHPRPNGRMSYYNHTTHERLILGLTDGRAIIIIQAKNKWEYINSHSINTYSEASGSASILTMHWSYLEIVLRYFIKFIIMVSRWWIILLSDVSWLGPQFSHCLK